ncbi:MAG: transcription antitermination factor NusB, partial [Monoglobaceae bacterium]
MSISPRQAVSDALFNIEKNGEYSTKAVLDTVKNFEPRDRAFVNEALLGILRNKIYIDFIIQSFSKLKLKKISPYVLQILRTGAYQILF